jgi:hypothetical protein
MKRKMNMKMKFLVLVLSFGFAQFGFAQWGTSFDFLHTQSLRINYKTGNTSKGYQHNLGFSVGAYYQFKEKMVKAYLQSSALHL